MDDNFFDKVFELVSLIPSGKVTLYGAIVKHLGIGKSARVVGWAMNMSHSHTKYVPAHRVVNRNGMLTGKHHFANENMMEELLKAEEITVVDDKIIDFKKHFWEPMKELG